MLWQLRRVLAPGDRHHRGRAGPAGKVTTITRTNGSHQLTYNGHPLYTYIGDTAPGQARGNNLNLNGGSGTKCLPPVRRSSLRVWQTPGQVWVACRFARQDGLDTAASPAVPRGQLSRRRYGGQSS